MITIREAEIEDRKEIWEWVNDPVTRQMFRDSHYIEWEEHCRWFEKMMKNQSQVMCVGMAGTLKVGNVRFDQRATGIYEVSINVNPGLRGQGYGAALLKKSVKYLQGKRDVHKFFALIKKINIPSQRVFLKSGFTIEESPEYFYPGMEKFSNEQEVYCELTFKKNRIPSQRSLNILLLGPEWRNGNIREFLDAKGHRVRMTEDVITLNFLQEHRIEWIISSGYAPIIKEPVISIYQHKIINLHISLLPYGRGISPNLWSSFEGVPNGVSIHFIDAGIDTGKVLFQREITFTSMETLRTSHDRLLTELQALFFEKFDDIIDGKYTLVDQAEFCDGVNYHTRRQTNRLLELFPLRWNTPIKEVAKMGEEFKLSESRFWEKYEGALAGDKND